jgi:hypothetical protein
VKAVCWQNTNLPLEVLLRQLGSMLRGSPGVLSLSHDVAPKARRRRFATCLSH